MFDSNLCHRIIDIGLPAKDRKQYLLVMTPEKLSLSLVPNCPKNRKNRGFLRYSDVWDSYDQWGHVIPEIPDGQRILRCDRKNRNHFYFEGTVPDIPDIPDVGEF